MINNICLCRKCSLSKYQPPLFDNMSEADIIIVGLSAKKKRFLTEIPLDGTTRSGNLINAMELIANKYNYKIYRTNLVKCAPLDEKDHLRYPTPYEMDSCFANFLIEQTTLRPRIVILLGNMVQNQFEKKMSFHIDNSHNCNFPYVVVDNCYYVASYHPSYVMRSKIRTEAYLQNFEEFLKKILMEN